MKTKLLFSIFASVLFSGASIAQTKIWDLGGGVAPWAASPNAYTSNVVIDNLGLMPGVGVETFGVIETHARTFATTPAYTSVNRFKNGGGGSPEAATPNLPTKRFLYFAAAGSVSVEVLYYGAGSSSRTLYVTNGTTVLGSATIADSTNPQILTTTATAVNGNVYIYGDNGINIYRVKVTGPLGTTTLSTLGTDDFKNNSSVNVFSSGKQINIANVKSSIQVDVYNITGALVKSVKTDSDTSFDSLTAGLYIVRVKSEEGQKAVKVAIK